MENFPIHDIAKEMLMLDKSTPGVDADIDDEVIEDDGDENVDCCCVGCPQQSLTEDSPAEDVVENFELLHRAIPWLEKAGVSSGSHTGQLKILQAAIDYIIDLEEQLTEHLSDDLYRVAIRESKAALERSLRSRRPFADMNATEDEADDDEECFFDMEVNHQQQQQQQQPSSQQGFSHQLSSATFLGVETALHRPW